MGHDHGVIVSGGYPGHRLLPLAGLEVIFPGRPVEAALLYTAAPVLLVLPRILLDAHKPGYVAAQ